MNRDWIANIMNTLLRQKFKDFVKLKICNYVNHVVNKKKLTVIALPEFANILKKSKNTSIKKDGSNYLIKLLVRDNGERLSAMIEKC